MKLSYFQRCFLHLFHCRKIRREARVVVGRGQIMPHTLRPLLTVGARGVHRLRLSKWRRVGVTAASPHSPPP